MSRVSTMGVRGSRRGVASVFAGTFACLAVMYACGDSSSDHLSPETDANDERDLANDAGSLPLDAASDVIDDGETGSDAHHFVIYEYLFVGGYIEGGTTISQTGFPPTAWVTAQGLHPMNLVYSVKLLDGGVADPVAISTIAKASDGTGVVPVNLDLETWDSLRFGSPSTVIQNIESVLKPFRDENPTAVVGVYGEVPQTTFGYGPTTASIYTPLNAQYAPLAAEVDYYAPSLYNVGYGRREFLRLASERRVQHARST